MFGKEKCDLNFCDTKCFSNRKKINKFILESITLHIFYGRNEFRSQLIGMISLDIY